MTTGRRAACKRHPVITVTARRAVVRARVRDKQPARSGNHAGAVCTRWTFTHPPQRALTCRPAPHPAPEQHATEARMTPMDWQSHLLQQYQRRGNADTRAGDCLPVNATRVHTHPSTRPHDELLPPSTSSTRRVCATHHAAAVVHHEHVADEPAGDGAALQQRRVQDRHARLGAAPRARRPERRRVSASSQPGTSGCTVGVVVMLPVQLHRTRYISCRSAPWCLAAPRMCRLWVKCRCQCQWHPPGSKFAPGCSAAGSSQPKYKCLGCSVPLNLFIG